MGKTYKTETIYSNQLDLFEQGLNDLKQRQWKRRFKNIKRDHTRKEAKQ